MQHRATASRDSALAIAADSVERSGAGLGLLLRESRLEVWEERDEHDLRMLELVLDEYSASFYARRITHAKLTIPDEPGAWETVIDSEDVVLSALRRAIPELDSFELAEAEVGELPAADPDGPVATCLLDGLWYRSKSERRIAAALEAANVLFAPNASVRIGITPDHRDTMEPDFLVWQDGKLGVLEVDGPWHTRRAAEDHERDHRFREHGIRVVERLSG